jgi:hypothetical protein
MASIYIFFPLYVKTEFNGPTSQSQTYLQVGPIKVHPNQPQSLKDKEHFIYLYHDRLLRERRLMGRSIHEMRIRSDASPRAFP